MKTESQAPDDGAAVLYPSARDVVYLCERCFVARRAGAVPRRYRPIDPKGTVKKLARSVGYFRRCADCARSDRFVKDLEIEPYELLPVAR